MRLHIFILLFFILIASCASVRTAEECNRLGMQSRSAGDIEGAIKYHKCAVTKEPENVEYVNNLGRAYFKARDYKNAALMFSKAAGIKLNDTAILKNLGAALGYTHEYARSASAYLKAIELNPLDYRAYFELAIVYAMEGSMDKAYDIYNKLNDLEPDQAGELLKILHGPR
jgi:tetratricopeptide (TPR) repeat protein